MTVFLNDIFTLILLNEIIFIQSLFKPDAGGPIDNKSLSVDTWRNNNVIIISKRRFDTIMMLLLRYVLAGLLHQ